MDEICVNKIINDLESGAQYLVLWVAPGNEYGYWYDLTSRSRKPMRFETAEVAAARDIGQYELTAFASEQTIRTEASLKESDRIHRDRVWNIIQTAVEAEPEIYSSKTRMPILRETAIKNSVDVSYLYVLLDKYWRSGKTKNAFVPLYNNCGAKGKMRKAYHNDGARRTQDATAGKTLSESDRDHFVAAINKYYLTRNKLSLKSVYERLLYDFYSTDDTDGKTEHKLLPPNERPSFRQFSYWYHKYRDTTAEQKKRDGEKAFELTGRAVLGKSDFGLMGPGAQFQLDATVGDIYLVSQFDRSNLIGRPVLYFILDVFSRMVVGMSVGLEGPSWIGAATAIANMAADKVAYCREYGVEITEDEWPCHHIPSALLCDRGEMISKNADNLVNVLGIRIINTPPYRADLKGIVEQHFRTINTNSVALLPGGVKPDMSKRGGHDYRLDAVLDIRQFTSIIINCVLHYNKYHYLDYIKKSEAMIGGQVEAIPLNLWNWGVRHISGALRSFPEEQVRLAVMPTDTATITGKGIRFKGMFYSSDRAIRERWFEKARAKKTWKVIVSYDPRNMAVIYLWNDDGKEYDACSLLDWDSRNAGKCLDEIVYEQQKERIIAKQLKVSETEAKVNLNADIDAIVAEAQGMKKSLPYKSKREQVSQIKENRRQEREAIRAESASVPDPVDNPSVQGSPEEEMSPTLRMIKQKMEERLKNG